MKIKTRQRRTNFVAILLLLAIAGGAAVYALRLEDQTVQPKTSSVVATVAIGQKQLTIPSWQLFQVGHMWELVSASHLLDTNYVPSLVPAPVAHVTGDFAVSTTMAPSLVALFEAAKHEGVTLMLSSAYRSATDQQALYNEYSAMYGKQYVHDYVALPGASEHQTGLAVDIAALTSSCVATGTACSLDAPAVAWLRTHAADYGFVERYPEGKQSITSIAGEHWHYRYVGVPLAQALTAAGMTLDEFVQQTAPGIR